MKFITEYDLRAEFSEHSFSEYLLKDNVRLTPGASSFLSDRKVKVVRAKAGCAAAKDGGKVSESVRLLASEEIKVGLELMEAYFLEAAQAAMDDDFDTANKIVELRDCLKYLREHPDENKLSEKDTAQEIQELKIFDFYLSCGNAKKIVALNLLYVRMKKFRLYLLKVYDNAEISGIDRRLIYIINSLAELIFRLVDSCKSR